MVEMRMKRFAPILMLLGAIGVLTGCAAGTSWYWPPDVTLTADPTMGVPPLEVTFNIAATAAPYREIVGFTLDFGDGTAPASGTELSLPILHTYTAVGTFTAKVRVTDSSGLTGEDVAVVTVIPLDGDDALNPPPTASFTYSPASPLTFESIAFNASGSTDPGGLLQPETIVEYSWDFDDGEFATGIMTTHQYSDNGDYTVTLTVIDDGGAIHSTSRPITVRNRPPVAKPSCGPTEGDPPLLVRCSGGGSYDEDGTIVSYQWDFDAADGIDWSPPDAEGVEVSHTYTDIGDYTLTLRVLDDDGAEGTRTVAIRVKSVPPVAKIKTTPEPPEGPAPLTVEFDGSDSYDPDGGPIVSWEWDFNAEDGLWWDSSPTPPPGEGATGVIVTHTYNTPGDYKVVLRVQDDEGDYGTASVGPVKVY